MYFQHYVKYEIRKMMAEDVMCECELKKWLEEQISFSKLFNCS